jgi:hypothetical protein
MEFEQVIERGCGIDVRKLLAETIHGTDCKSETCKYGAFTAEPFPQTCFAISPSGETFPQMCLDISACVETLPQMCLDVSACGETFPHMCLDISACGETFLQMCLDVSACVETSPQMCFDISACGETFPQMCLDISACGETFPQMCFDISPCGETLKQPVLTFPHLGTPFLRYILTGCVIMKRLRRLFRTGNRGASLSRRDRMSVENSFRVFTACRRYATCKGKYTFRTYGTKRTMRLFLPTYCAYGTTFPADHKHDFFNELIIIKYLYKYKI